MSGEGGKGGSPRGGKEEIWWVSFHLRAVGSKEMFQAGRYTVIDLSFRRISLVTYREEGQRG